MATTKEVEKVREATNVKLFGKWSFNELEVRTYGGSSAWEARIEPGRRGPAR